MRIKKVRLKNGYKRFRDLTIDLGDKPARIVALVGPNGSGKSSVLDGLLYHQQRYERIGDTGQRDYRYHSMDADSSFDNQNVEIDFVGGSYGEIWEVKHKIGRGNTILSFRSSYRYNANIKINQIIAVNNIGLNSYGASDASSIDFKNGEQLSASSS
jgi:DNA repair exonuclease SbcCD ATPase subunit